MFASLLGNSLSTKTRWNDHFVQDYTTYDQYSEQGEPKATDICWELAYKLFLGHKLQHAFLIKSINYRSKLLSNKIVITPAILSIDRWY